jgi:hypothetical protein
LEFGKIPKALSLLSLGEGRGKNRRILLREKTRSYPFNRQIRLKVIKKGALDLINTPYSDGDLNPYRRLTLMQQL